MRLRFLFLVLALGLIPMTGSAGNLLNPVIETQIAQVPVAPAVFAAQLRQHLPMAKITQTNDGRIEIGYSGSVGQSFKVFIAENAPTIEPFNLLPGATLSLSILLSPVNSGTELRLMSQSEYDPERASVFETAFGTSLPDGAKVLSQEAMPGTCTKMLVYQDTANVDATQAALQGLMDAQGTPFVSNDDGTGTLLMGETPNCGIFVYIQPDPEVPTQSLVAVRLMEK